MYAKILQSGIVSEKYNLETNTYVLNVYEKESTLIACKERIERDSYYKYLREYYLHVTYDNLTKRKTT